MPGNPGDPGPWRVLCSGSRMGREPACGCCGDGSMGHSSMERITQLVTLAVGNMTEGCSCPIWLRTVWVFPYRSATPAAG